MDCLTIGGLSKRTGCKVETIRYYERIGLLPAPPRTAGGHRAFGGDHLRRLFFVRRARGLGFTLEEVRRLLELSDGEGASCAEIRDLTLDHLIQVRHKLGDLRRLEAVLAGMAAQCEDGTLPDCPIIEALFEGATPDQAN
ncbi:MAG: helix-turn-helix domain-containing protein [Rhodospirillales bacterium]|nr:helix-turn-helix domain-containing protein [Rhodospirillales bacterium]